MSIAGVRLAHLADAPEIARIHRDTWQAAYRELLGEEQLNRLDLSDLTRAWGETITHPDTGTFVATEGSFTVGFCTAGLAPAPELADAEGNLPTDAHEVGLVASILVEPRWGRRGHGGRLLAAATTALSEQGAQRAIAWVVQQNAASLGFFRRLGWKPDGTIRTLDTGTGVIRELRLSGDLATTATTEQKPPNASPNT